MKHWYRTSILALFLLLGSLSALLAVTPKGVEWKKIKQTKHGLYQIDVVYPKFTANSPLANAASAAFRVTASKSIKSLKSGAVEGKNADPNFQPYALDITTTLGVVSSTVISGYLTDYSDSGGAHPNTILEPITFALVDNKPKKLALKDILKSGISPLQFASRIIIPRVNKMKKDRGGEIINSIDPAYLNNFIVTSKGITWLFSAYDIGSHAEGDYIINVPWKSLKTVLRSDGPLKEISGW